MINHQAPQIQLPVWRAFLLFSLLVLGLLALVGRAMYLQGMQNDFLQEKGASRYSRVVDMNVSRGMIADRNGVVLAVSSPIASVCADPELVEITNEQLVVLSSLLDMDMKDVKARLNRDSSRFVYLKRQVTPDITEAIADLNIPGIYLENESKRYYPAREAAAHVLGFTDINDEGQEGVERGWEETLAGELGSRRVIQDNKGRIIEAVENIRSPKQGQDVILSLDRSIQSLAHRELKKAVEAHQAKSGSIVVLDAQTGEVLAVTNLPVFNPNRKSTIIRESDGGISNVRNRAFVDAYEPGSTLKPFPVAIAIETGQINPDTVLETAPGTFRVGRSTIRDVSDKGDLTVAEIIQTSSNVGTAKIALSMPPQILWEMLHRSGFGTPTESGFPAEATGRLRPYSSWRPIEQATLSYGHGISVSLMQLARAYTLFTTGGQLLPVSLEKRNLPVMGQQVISRKTAQAVSAMLEMVTQPGGTAPLAQVNGYRVAGKTGTAHKLIDGRYAKKIYTSSFVGYAPVSNPRLIIAVVLDEPSAGQYFGGAVAAPVFSSVMAGALRILNVPHDAPANNVVLFQAEQELDGEV